MPRTHRIRKFILIVKLKMVFGFAYMKFGLTKNTSRATRFMFDFILFFDLLVFSNVLMFLFGRLFKGQNINTFCVNFYFIYYKKD